MSMIAFTQHRCDRVIRRARNSDAAALAALARHTYAVAFGLAEYLRDDRIWVAVEGAGLYGFIQTGRARDTGSGDAGAWELGRLYVREDRQGQKVGSRLMERAFAHPDVQAAPFICLDVWEENTGAIRLYARYGFEVVGRRRFKVRSGVEMGFGLLMVRRRDGNTAVDKPICTS